MNNSITALKGVRVGHSTHPEELTGCTFISFEKNYPIAYKSYGGAPGTYATENLKNGMSYSTRDGLFIAGGSLNGLTSAGEIIDRLIEKKEGFAIGKTLMPTISGAIVWDLGVGMSQFNSIYGKEAVDDLSSEPVKNGNVGAGTGTSVGKFSYTKDGLMLGMKSGVGSARIDLGHGVMICALSVVNALGNVVLPNGEILAGNRHDVDSPKFRSFKDSSDFLTEKSMNTTISIVGINVDLINHENYDRVAHIATHGQVRAINPVHTSRDGDTVFVFSTEEIKDFLGPVGKSISSSGWSLLDVDIIGQAAADAIQESIYDACRKAETIKLDQAFEGIVPSAKDYK